MKVCCALETHRANTLYEKLSAAEARHSDEIKAWEDMAESHNLAMCELERRLAAKDERIARLREALADNTEHDCGCSFIIYVGRRGCDCSLKYSVEAIAHDDQLKNVP